LWERGFFVGKLIGFDLFNKLDIFTNIIGFSFQKGGNNHIDLRLQTKKHQPPLKETGSI
jgi:hypothetical protein